MALSHSLQVVSDISNGVYEIGFCSIKPDDQDLRYFKIAEDEIVLIVHPGHHFSSKKEISLADLNGEPLILREEPVEKHQSAASLLLKAGFDISRCKPKLVLGTNMGVISAVEARAGISFISDLAVKKSEALGWVKIVKIKGLTLKRDFYCIYRESRMVSRLLQEFITFMQNRSFPQPPTFC